MRRSFVVLVVLSLVVGCEKSENPNVDPPTSEAIAVALNQNLSGLSKIVNGYANVQLRDGVFIDSRRYEAFINADYVWKVGSTKLEEILKQHKPPVGKVHAGAELYSKRPFEKGKVISPNLNIRAFLIRCQNSWQIEHPLSVEGLTDPLALRDISAGEMRVDVLYFQDFCKDRRIDTPNDFRIDCATPFVQSSK